MNVRHDNLHWGIWAGDKFQLTTIERIRGAKDGWRDVGMTEVEVLWKAQCGSDWKEMTEWSSWSEQ